MSDGVETWPMGSEAPALDQSVTSDSQPYLSLPRSLRILIHPWTDADKDLHGGGYVHVRLEDSQWILPKVP